MKIDMKPDQGWQKAGIILLVLLYAGLAAIPSINQLSARGPEERVDVWRYLTGQQTEQVSDQQDHYKEIEKVAITFDDEVIIGLNPEILCKRRSSSQGVVSVI